MFSRIVGIGLVIAFMSAPAASLRAEDEKPEGDLKTIQGKWSTKNPNGDKITYTVDGKKMKVVTPTRSYQITMKLDPMAKPEKTLDLVIDEAPEDAKGKTSKAIYKIDGEKFIFCFSPEGDRPTKYEMEGYEKIVVSLTKDKD